MFRKKKSSLPDNGQAVPRSRNPAARASGGERDRTGNPLARRFQVDSEPPTIDLTSPPRFKPAPHEAEDPKTATLQSDAAQLSRFISREPGTGKFYVHPGAEGLPVILQGEPVVAPTELRRGDIIAFGDAEFHFRSAP
ncbi:MAG: hypothetical protein OQK01_08425 [Xanthomonadales bacterium]|jgi:hypothetical protein|nr:hypothetical protein [Xanthomonadales bacterium]